MSSFDAGRIVATADVDRTPFQQGLRLLKHDAREFADKKITATADLDTRPGEAKIVDFKQRLDSVARAKATAQVAVDNGQAIRKLIETSDRLDRMRAQVARARVDADTDQARRKLDELDIALRRIGLVTSRPRVTLEGVERANLQLDSLALKLAAVGGAGSGHRGGGGSGGGGFLSRFAASRVPAPGFMPLALGAAIPAALPLAGLGLGAGASLLAPTLAGGIGLGAFGLGAKASITTVAKDVATLTKLTQQYNAATTDKQRAAVLAKEDALWRRLDPAQRAAVKNVHALDESWERFQKRLEPQSFKALADGAKLAQTGLGLLFPVARATGVEIDYLAKRAETALKQPFWHEFFGHFLAEEAPAAVDALARTVGNFGTGIAHLAEAVSPLGLSLEQLLVKDSARFERWTEGDGPGRFVNWVHREAPIVGRDLKAIVGAVRGIGEGIAPIGQVELRLLAPVLEDIAKLGDSHPEVITAIGTALLVVGGGLKAISLAQGAAGVLGKLITLGKGRGGVGGGGLGAGVDALAGRGSSPANPLYVFVVDKEPGGHPSTPGGPVRTAQNLAKKVLPFAADVAPSAVTIAGGAYGFTQLASAFAPSFRHYLQVAMDPQTAKDRAQRSMAQTYVAQKYPNIPVGTPDYYSAVAQTIQHTGGRSGFVGDFKLQGIPASELAKIASAAAGPANAAGVKIGEALNVGFDHELQRKLAGNVSARASIGQIARNAAQAAGIGGVGIADALASGLENELRARLTRYAQHDARVQVGQIVKNMRQAVGANSPAKATIDLGRDLAMGVDVGWTAYQPSLLKLFGGSAKTMVAHLGTQLNNAANQYRSDLQARAAMSSSISGQIMGLADIGNAGLSNTGGATVGGFLASQIATDRTFSAQLARLRKKGLDPRLLQQIANAGPDRGGMLAQQILGGGESIRSLNAQERQLGSLSGGIGNTVAGATFSGTLARDQRSIEHIARAIETLVAHKLDLSPHTVTLMEHAFERALRRAFPTLNVNELDKILGQKILAH